MIEKRSVSPGFSDEITCFDARVPPELDVNDLVLALPACASRQDAQRILVAVETTERLILLAKAMNAHTVKNDRREDVQNKLITFAIRGKRPEM